MLSLTVNCCSRMKWSTVSNAALKCRCANINISPVSTALSKLDMILVRVSIEKMWRYTDWTEGSVPTMSKWALNAKATILSSIFDSNDTLEIGRKLLSSSESSLSVFSTVVYQMHYLGCWSMAVFLELSFCTFDLELWARTNVEIGISVEWLQAKKNERPDMMLILAADGDFPARIVFIFYVESWKCMTTKIVILPIWCRDEKVS